MLNVSRSYLRHRLVSGALVLTATIVVAACNTDRNITGSVPSAYPVDYRARHPIRLTEGEQDIQLLVGSGRGDLTADQRAQVSQMASEWRTESSGRLVIDVPKGSKNDKAAQYAARETLSLLRAYGVPPSAIRTNTYAAPPDSFGPVRLSFAKIQAVAGPCGLWPEDLGASPIPSLQRVPPQMDNRPYWNFGCAYQHNLAAMVANPEDFVQPRASTPSYAPRRQMVIEKYRKGEIPSGKYDTDDASISEVGQ